MLRAHVGAGPAAPVECSLGLARAGDAAGGVPAEGPTYKKMRSVPWASYIQNRLIIPDGRDQVAISDYLDADLYDPFWQSFRAGAGGSDYIVAVHPWVEGSALVFARKSIWPRWPSSPAQTAAALPSTRRSPSWS